MELFKRFIVLTLCFCPALPGLTRDDVINMPANSWLEVPNSHMIDVMPTDQEMAAWGLGGRQEGIMMSWNGGVYDTKRERFIIWGGGHNDYDGNEVYAFSLSTMAWQRLNDPTHNPIQCEEKNQDGTANTRHTYNGLAYIPSTDRFFAAGGALNCDAGGGPKDTLWTFNFDSLTWRTHDPAGSRPNTGLGNMCAYDAVNDKLWYMTNASPPGLYSFDAAVGTGTRHSGTTYQTQLYNRTAVFDSKRELLVIVGRGGEHATALPPGVVHTYDVGNGDYTLQALPTTGADGFVSNAAPGLAYDPVSDRVVGWNGGSSVYALNMDTREWAVHTASWGPPKAKNNTYGRFRYVPSVNAFINVNQVDSNVYFYKLTAGAGVTGKKAPRKSGGISVSPNPFKRTLKIAVSWQRIADSNIGIAIYDIKGKMVHRLSANSYQLSAGITWNASGLPAGIYIIKARTGSKTFTKKITLIR